MEELILIISFFFLLTGVFVFRKLWLGALTALLLLVSMNTSTNVLHALSNAGIIWFELMLLLFGAYLFYHVLSDNHHFRPFTESINNISSKLSVVFIVCWFMGSFMEGIAGFGIPTLLIAPLMLAAGFRPTSSVVLPLATNTTAVVFGALGTPLKIGLGIHESDTQTLYIILLNGLPALLIPFVLAHLYSITEQETIHWKTEWKTALSAGLCFYIPFTLTGLFSVEFPSVAGGMVGLVFFVLLVIPKREKPGSTLWLKTFYPYVFFIVLLLSWRLVFQPHSFSFFPHTKLISFYQPGFVFFLASLLLFIYLRGKKTFSHYTKLASHSLYHIRFSALNILLLVCFSQLVSGSLSGPLNFFLGSLNQPLQLAAQPFLGIMGSFISGSATMSNLMLGPSLLTLAAENKILLTALLHTGSAIGNCISLQNIVMVNSVIPRAITESKIIRLNGRAVVLYAVLIIIVSLFIQHVNL